MHCSKARLARSACGVILDSTSSSDSVQQHRAWHRSTSANPFEVTSGNRERSLALQGNGSHGDVRIGTCKSSLQEVPPPPSTWAALWVLRHALVSSLSRQACSIASADSGADVRARLAAQRASSSGGLEWRGWQAARSGCNSIAAYGYRQRRHVASSAFTAIDAAQPQ